MEFQLAFGSVGDFIAIGLLIRDIVRALDDARGSSKQYQDTIKHLNDLNNAFREIQQVVQASTRYDALAQLHKAITSLATDVEVTQHLDLRYK